VSCAVVSCAVVGCVAAPGRRPAGQLPDVARGDADMDVPLWPPGVPARQLRR